MCRIHSRHFFHTYMLPQPFRYHLNLASIRSTAAVPRPLICPFSLFPLCNQDVVSQHKAFCFDDSNQHFCVETTFGSMWQLLLFGTTLVLFPDFVCGQEDPANHSEGFTGVLPQTQYTPNKSLQMSEIGIHPGT